MSEKIAIDLSERSPAAEIALSAGRVVGLRRSPRPARCGVSWATRRPGWGAASRGAEELIAKWTAPRMTLAEIEDLRRRDRRRLLLAIVRAADAEADWRALYGTSLNTDERFVAVMRWNREHELTEPRESLAASRRALRRQTSATPKAMSEAVLAVARPRDLALSGNAGIFAATTQASGIAAFAASPGTARIGMDRGRPAREAILPNLGSAHRLLESATTAGAGLGLAGFGGVGIARFGGLPEATCLGAIEAIGERFKGLGVSPSPFASTKLNEWSAVRAAVEPGGIGPGGRMSAASALAEQLRGGSAMRELIDSTLVSGRFDGGFAESLGVAGLGLGRFGLDLPRLDPWPGLGERFRETLEGLTVVEYTRAWAHDPLWFLLEFFSPTELPKLLGPREVVYEAVLDGLEVVVCGSDLVPELAGALGGLPFLTEIQREWLRFGLDHARLGEWTQAVANLFAGFEGALHSGAVAEDRINSEREGRLIGAETIIKSLELSEDLEAFAIRLAFGGRGNAFRHGRPGGDARDQVLLLVVALIGWVDSMIGSDGVGALVAELRAPLREAIERVPLD